MFQDIDGDGFVDFLDGGVRRIFTNSADSTNQVRVNKSQLGKINRLKSVTLPTCGSYHLDYAVSAATYNHPGGKWVLDSLCIKDNTPGDGVDERIQRFEYSQGKYDRCEREFLGFRKVEAIDIDEDQSSEYRKAVTFYFVDYFRRGLPQYARIYDGSNKLFTNKISTYFVKELHPRTNNIYDLGGNLSATGIADPNSTNYDPRAIVFVAPNRSTLRWYEGDNSKVFVASVSRNTYDDYGAVRYHWYSNEDQNLANSAGKYRYRTLIKYVHDNDNNYFSRPNRVIVSDGTNSNARVREERAAYYPNLPKLKYVKHYFSHSGQSQTNFTYYNTGMLRRITLPHDWQNRRMWYNFTYENRLKTHVTLIKDRFGYISRFRTWDYRWGISRRHTDINGHDILFTLDTKGRIISILGPKEAEADKDYTVKYTYTDTYPFRAKTQRYDPEHPSDSLESVSFTDGFGRVVQTNAEAIVDPTGSGSPQTGILISGRVEYDAFGRVARSFYPSFDPAGNLEQFGINSSNEGLTSVSYDVLDREEEVSYPRGGLTREFGFGDDKDGIERMMTTEYFPCRKDCKNILQSWKCSHADRKRIGEWKLDTNVICI